ncbi:hypothetical protein [Lacibacter sediminis]|uniref:DUF4268 domain-containing protein n=1 Tax=Lacibacter sediminis TaxID=2760713 RepID=A0A7G5XI94_9BACT|nr:hypothetical protein [Lacibacter sediminis]QNA45197.1 hypothetical protein H4075_03065 [Lacibacter sediminis]
MQESSKVSLSAFERQLVTDANWILTKNRIIEKVYLLFGNLSELYKVEPLLQKLPAEALLSSPKIAKGENYEGLPYVMLDYPRCFGKEDTLAIRTFFWWGNFFSITLQLKGNYLKEYASVIQQNITTTADEELWINTADEEWMHHFRSDNMIRTTEHQQSISDKKILKLAVQCKLEEWDNAETKLTNSFQRLLDLLQEH